MPRRIEVTLPPAKTDALIERAQKVTGVTSVSLQRGMSVSPPGDIVVIQATTDGERDVLHVLRDLEVTDGGSFTTSELKSLIATPHAKQLEQENNEMTWEEVGFFLRLEVNPSGNYFALIALCGVIAATGLWLDLVHIVIGAMVIAPGFEPLLRLPFGLVSGPREHVKVGLASTVLGYGALLLAAAVTLPVLGWIDPMSPADLHARDWVTFWSTTTPTSVLVALVAGTAGMVTVTANRAVLTAGVMIALALIPSMTIVGLALAAQDLPLALAALQRWTVDVLGVIIAGAVVMVVKQKLIHQKPALG